ncbi:MAG: quinone-dependent dihydroorotate dehydrogenase [Candidatus Paceibacterota bacterium]|jgi:dihydroorotate dehydrogenase
MRNDTATLYRNKTIHALYATILKPIFFRNDPELVHDWMTKAGVLLGRYSLGRAVTSAFFNYRNPSLLGQTIRGMRFENPIGLSAGFDKNAQLGDILPSVGFGFVEMGSITGEPCEGNPKPRLWRMPKSRGLVVYYGLKNDGCEAIVRRLEGKKFSIPIGMSVAMTNCIENMDTTPAIADFAKAFRVMEPYADYVTVNISCPNTVGGQPFVAPDKLEALFRVIDAIPTEKSVFIKISPNMTDAELGALLDVARCHRIHGIVCANLTKPRDNPNIVDADVPRVGGMSGKVVMDLSDEILAKIYKREGKRFVLVGAGGVFTAEDAYKKIRLGASLVQLITGMVFEGPQAIGEINRGLVALLKRDGFSNISQAIGIDTC